jgi:hypothetical protein
MKYVIEQESPQVLQISKFIEDAGAVFISGFFENRRCFRKKKLYTFVPWNQTLKYNKR